MQVCTKSISIEFIKMANYEGTKKSMKQNREIIYLETG